MLDLEPFADKGRAFGWSVRELDGHDHEQIRAALESAPFEPGRPSVLQARAVRGKGVGFMEDQLLWHYKSVDADRLTQVLEELEASR